MCRDTELLARFWRQCALLLFVVVVLLSAVGCRMFQRPWPPVWSTRSCALPGVFISIPEHVDAQEGAEGRITLVHAIPCRHADPCDWRGKPAILENLTDFSLKIQVVDQALAETFRATFPQTAKLNIAQGDIRVEPGYIEAVDFGGWRGYRVEVSCEGCGVYHYLFPVGTNRTLLLER